MTLFGNVSNDVTLEITDSQSEYKFISVKEISALKSIPTEKFDNLSITSHSPYMTLRLWKHGGELHISEDSITLRGFMEKAKDRLKSRSKKLHWIYTSPLVMATLPILSAYYGVWELGHKNYMSGAIIIVLSLCWMVLNWYCRFYNYTVIFCKSQKELPTFFQRRKDDIFIAVISGSIGAIVGALLAKFI